ncbi:Inositol polyphosphate phosphatase, catalytic domain ues [Dionaea muscipula]
MKQQRHHHQELLWPKVVMRKWLNISSKDSDFSADIDDDDWDSDNRSADSQEFQRKLRRQNSETFRAQYVNTKEIRICVGTWNVAGRVPPDDLDIEEWLDVSEPSEVYVLGLQEIVPLNAGNIFGAGDSRPVINWENIIRDTLNRIPPMRNKCKSFSDPPSPTKFKPYDDAPDLEDEVLLGSDGEDEEEFDPLEEEPGLYEVVDKACTTEDPLMNTGVQLRGDPINPHIQNEQNLHVPSSKKLDRARGIQLGLREEDEEPSTTYQTKLTEMPGGREKIGLIWPESPRNLFVRHVLERPNSSESKKSLKSVKSFGMYGSFKSRMDDDRTDSSLLMGLDLESIIQRRRKPEYVRIVSKQMVGIFLTIWVRRDLRKHIQNLKVSTVGVGVMGYFCNKGSVSVSMSIYQTLFCIICTHLTSGDKEGDEIKRNSDVHEIHRRTLFRPASTFGLPKSIHDHERIIWLGDLNYRINLPYEKTRELISKKQWSKLVMWDQLVQQLKEGRAFEGWSEGALNFPPTYKYEFNSDKYYGQEPKAAGRRTPAWCDRVLSFGKGIKLMKYKRSELYLSDHRPVTATYNIVVEACSARKLQRALTLTDAELNLETLK